MVSKLLVLGLLLPFNQSQLSFASSACAQWSAKEEIGNLDHKIINESSGVEFSNQFDNRLYHINDSGDGAYFYQTDAKGQDTKKVEVKNFFPFDVESIEVAKCGKNDCIFIGDIGDNKHVRDELTIVLIEELKEFQNKVEPLKTFKLKYPQGKYDAEGMAVHPVSGDLYIMTKNADYKARTILVSPLFKVAAKQWQEAKNGDVLTLEKVAEFDLNYINYEYNFWGRLVTAMDIAPDGKSFVFLTYKNALIFDIDLAKQQIASTKDLVEQKVFNEVELVSLPQIEAIAYAGDGKSLIYTTEYKKEKTPIMKISCQMKAKK